MRDNFKLYFLINLPSPPQHGTKAVLVIINSTISLLGEDILRQCLGNFGLGLGVLPNKSIFFVSKISGFLLLRSGLLT